MKKLITINLFLYSFSIFIMLSMASFAFAQNQNNNQLNSNLLEIFLRQSTMPLKLDEGNSDLGLYGFDNPVTTNNLSDNITKKFIKELERQIEQNQKNFQKTNSNPNFINLNDNTKKNTKLLPNSANNRNIINTTSSTSTNNNSSRIKPKIKIPIPNQNANITQNKNNIIQTSQSNITIEINKLHARIGFLEKENSELKDDILRLKDEMSYLKDIIQKQSPEYRKNNSLYPNAGKLWNNNNFSNRNSLNIDNNPNKPLNTLPQELSLNKATSQNSFIENPNNLAENHNNKDIKVPLPETPSSNNLNNTPTAPSANLTNMPPISLTNRTTNQSIETQYKLALKELELKNFEKSQTILKEILKNNPKHKLAPNAKYWLGETYFAKGDYKAAAKEFLQGYSNFGSSTKAADNLLKLAISFQKLGQIKESCTVLIELLSKSNFASTAILRRAEIEKTRLKCN